MSDATLLCFRRFALGLVAVMLGAAAADAETISGVCPDGSIFIVQRPGSSGPKDERSQGKRRGPSKLGGRSVSI